MIWMKKGSAIWIGYIMEQKLSALKIYKWVNTGFSKLCQSCKKKGGLQWTRNVSIEEVVAMFLNILGHNLKYWSIHLSYYCSKETISRQFNKDLHAVMKISKEYVRSQECVQGGETRWRWFEVLIINLIQHFRMIYSTCYAYELTSCLYAIELSWSIRWNSYTRNGFWGIKAWVPESKGRYFY